MSILTRRAFLQAGTAAGSLAITTSGAAWLIPDRRMNFAIIGSEQAAVHHLAALASHPNARISLVTSKSVRSLKNISMLLREQNVSPPRLSTQYDEAFYDPAIAAICISGQERNSSQLLRTAFTTAKPVLFDVPPSPSLSVAGYLTPSARVLTCLDGLCTKSILVNCAALQRLGSIESITLRLTSGGKMPSDHRQQLPRIAALFDALLAACEADSTSDEITNYRAHPVFSNLRLVRIAARSQAPEILMNGTRGQVLLTSRRQSTFQFVRSRLHAFVDAVGSENALSLRATSRHFQAMALAESALKTESA